MTATSEIRFGPDGTAKVQSYVRLTASTWIRCCTYQDEAPILTIQDGPAEITITNPGRGEVTEEDVRFGRLILPVLGKVTATRYTDRVAVRLVSGQSPADVARHADALAHGFGAMLCRVRSARSGRVVLEFVRRDALAAIVPALPIPADPDLKALPVGRREDGLAWCVRLHGTHVLVAGATGAGKASLLWGLVRAMFPLMQAGLARVLAADPKLMKLAYGRVIFETYGAYAADPVSIAAMLDQAVADMQERAARFAGRQRDHTPTIEDPFTVVLVDEVAFLTAYQPDRKLRERIMLALATLTTQGRALGYAVVAALQDPRKDVLTIRNLFPDRIAMRLDEPEQVEPGASAT